METNVCQLCGGSSVKTLIRRKGVPVFQNHLYREAALAKAAPTGEIDLTICETCGFVQNSAFEACRVQYGSDYENDQSHSSAFLAHINAMADRVLAALPSNGTLIEVGCGQGYFLMHLASRLKGQQPKLYGFDPSYRGGETRERVSMAAASFDHKVASDLGVRPDVLLSRHVIEHVQDPVAFLSAIREGAGKSPVRLFIETPCFEWIASNRVFQDIFYEHVNYFTASTLTDALRRAGFATVKVEHVFNGQYLWAEAIASEQSLAAAAPYGSPLSRETAANFAREFTAQLGYWARLLDGGPPTALWGAGAKGVTFASLVDPDRSRIDCLIDGNPGKQGAFVPVTAHPIVSPRDGAGRRIKQILVMNPNYRTEIEKDVENLRWPAQLIDAGMRAA